MNCQRNWLYLEQIFSNPDIQVLSPAFLSECRDNSIGKNLELQSMGCRLDFHYPGWGTLFGMTFSKPLATTCWRRNTTVKIMEVPTSG